ncbi:hypothetical protein Tco_1545836 [Tanacetum coccineum]
MTDYSLWEVIRNGNKVLKRIVGETEQEYEPTISINVLNLEVKLRDNALIKNKKKLEKAEKERDELKLTLEKFQNSSKSLNNLLEIETFVNTSEMLENQEHNKSKSDKGYHPVPLPFTWNFIPRKPDLTFMDEIVESENMDVTTIVTPSNVKIVESNHESAGVKRNGDAVEPKTVRKNSFRPPVIEDWNSDDESEVEIIPKDKTVSSSTEKIKLVKSARETVKKVLWIQNQMLDYGFNFMNTKIFIDNESTICIVKNPVFHSKTKHIEIRHHFIRDCYEKKLIQVIKIHTDHNVADLLTKAFDVSRVNTVRYLLVLLGLVYTAGISLEPKLQLLSKFLTLEALFEGRSIENE